MQVCTVIAVLHGHIQRGRTSLESKLRHQRFFNSLDIYLLVATGRAGCSNDTWLVFSLCVDREPWDFAPKWHRLLHGGKARYHGYIIAKMATLTDSCCYWAIRRGGAKAARV